MLDDVARADIALLQDPAFEEGLRVCGETPLRLLNGQLMLHRRLFNVPFAMLARAVPSRDLAEQLAFCNLHRTPVILSPPTPCLMPRAIRLRSPRAYALLDLSGTEPAARSSLHQKWRNQLRKAEQKNLTVQFRPFHPKKDGALLDKSQDHARTRGYALWPSALTAAVAAAAPHQTLLVTAAYAGRHVAHMLFFTHGCNATYHIGHTTAEGRRLCAHNLLLWRTTQHLRQNGFKTLDLGLLDDRTQSLNRFKLRTGAERRETGGTWLYWRPFARGTSRLCA
jgi:hypothetical protein